MHAVKDTVKYENADAVYNVYNIYKVRARGDWMVGCF